MTKDHQWGCCERLEAYSELLVTIIAKHCKDLSLELVLQYMLRMEFCTEIDPQALSLIPGFDQDCLQDRYYFFPSLISTERHSVIWLAPLTSLHTLTMIILSSQIGIGAVFLRTLRAMLWHGPQWALTFGQSFYPFTNIWALLMSLYHVLAWGAPILVAFPLLFFRKLAYAPFDSWCLVLHPLQRMITLQQYSCSCLNWFRSC